MTPLIVICAVGLTPDHLGKDTPALNAIADRGFAAPLDPSLPAVTTTCQTTMLTGVDPSQHGIVANGWYFRDQAEVWLWRQSEQLVQAPLVWDQIRSAGQPLKTLKHFWWYAMNSSADAFITPRPAYHADGSKSPDFYSWPAELKNTLMAAHGEFPLFKFWGPVADIESTTWIANSFVTAWKDQTPDLALCYLPHLDYDLQRHGAAGAHLSQNLRDLDGCIKTITDHAQTVGAEVLVVSEYGIEDVSEAIFINRRLRERNLLTVTVNATGELLDPGMSRAFAVCDHQLAHIYCRNPNDIDAARQALSDLPGIERLWVGDQRSELGLHHSRSGDLIALCEAGGWFAYDYWLDHAKRPDFADLVEIHKKPGYDPRELAFDPNGGKRRAGLALLRKKLGMRYRLAAIGQDPSVVKGSHGRAPSAARLGPVVIGSQADWALNHESWHQRDIAGLIRTALKA